MPKLGVPSQLLLCGPDVRFGSKADICTAKRHVRFTPNSDRESGLPKKFMSAYPRKRTCALRLGMSAMGQKRTCQAKSSGEFPGLLLVDNKLNQIAASFANRADITRQGQLRVGYYGVLDCCGIPAPPTAGHLMQYAPRLLGWLHVLHYQP